MSDTTDTNRVRTWRFAVQDWNLPKDPVFMAHAEHRPDGVIVFVEGELDLATAPTLTRRLFELLALPIEAMTLNLAKLDFLDSSGLHALNAVRVRAIEHGVPFSLDSLTRQVRMVLDVSAMARLFQITERGVTS